MTQAQPIPSTSSAPGSATRAGRAVPLVLGIVAHAGATNDAALIGERAGAVLDALRSEFPALPLVVLFGGRSAAERAVAEAAALRCIDVRPIASGDPRSVTRWSDAVIELGAPQADPLASVASISETARSNPRRLLAPPDTVARYQLDAGGTRRTFAQHAGEVEAEDAFRQSLRRRERYNNDVAGALDGAIAGESLRIATDAVANRFQRLARWWQAALYAMAIVAATLQIVPVPYGDWVKIGTLVAALAAYLFVRRRDYQNRYQDYRAVAEALRVRAAWCAAAIDEEVHESYLAVQQTDLQWIRDLLRALAAIDPAREAPGPGIASVVAWAQSQREYFRARSRSEGAWRDRLDRIAIPLTIVSFVAAALALVSGIPLLQQGDVLDIAGRIAALGAFGVATVHQYAHARGYTENASRYQRMLLVYDRALRVFERLRGDTIALRALAVELGREALTEHADWLLAQRTRPISVVHTGVG